MHRSCLRGGKFSTCRNFPRARQVENLLSRANTNRDIISHYYRIGFQGHRFKVEYPRKTARRPPRPPEPEETMARTAADQVLLDRCLKQEAGAWKAFVDRFLGLIFHVVERTSQLVGMPLRPADLEDVAAEILLQVIKNNFAVLRRFRGQSTLATYLTVIARRVCLQE